MRASWRTLVNVFRERSQSLLRKWEHFTSENRTVLAVTQDERCRMTLRVLSIEEGWRMLFAQSVEDALRLCSGRRPCVLLYDLDLPVADWQARVRWLLASEQPMFPIVLTEAPGAPLREEVVNCGGYDVARKPLEPEHLVSLVNGALALAESIDELASDRSYPPSALRNTHLPV